jgi:hypothetical protein
MAGPINPDTITFDAPVAFTDGTSIPPGTLLRYEYCFSQAQTGPFNKVIVDTDFTPDTQGKQTHELDLAGFAFGQWFGAARAVSKDGPVSALSNVAAFEVQAKMPRPPTGFTIA